ncbi:hypothetical protein ISCGN_000161 [Ixodes scapularis]
MVNARPLVGLMSGVAEEHGGASAPLGAKEHDSTRGIYIGGGRNLASSEMWPSTPVHSRRTKGAEEQHKCLGVLRIFIIIIIFINFSDSGRLTTSGCDNYKVISIAKLNRNVFDITANCTISGA